MLITSQAPGTAGTRYSYSNLGFALLGESLATALAPGSSYGSVISQMLLDPLGFSASTTMFGETDVSKLPQGYGPDGQPTRPGAPAFPAYYGGGGLVSTPADMLIWLRFNMGLTCPAPLRARLPATQQASTTVQTLHGSGLGLGWFLTTIDTNTGPLATIWKDGGYAGFHSYITFLPSPSPGTTASTAGVFVLTNSAAPVDAIARGILCLLDGRVAVNVTPGSAA
jgi:D-alanyl-D-alanine-carboxypeptidase/D-alanyl-D-alanine-endopeptidase